jgi:hypothetical protein
VKSAANRQFSCIRFGTRVALPGGVIFKAIVAACALAAAAADPFAPLAPVVSPSAQQRAALARGEIVAHIVPARHGQIAAFAAMRVNAPPEALLPAARDIGELKKSRFVEAIGRFSEPPQLGDLDALRLSPRDLQAVAGCEVGACSFKLSAIEIDTLKRLRQGDQHGEKVTAALRQVLFDRVMAYRTGGAAALPPIVNRGKPWRIGDVLTALHAESPQLLRQPPLDAWITNGGGVESFLYWSQEYYGAGKPVILLTHVAIYRPSPDAVVVVGKQFFSSRYINGAISMMTLATDDGGAHVLTYLNRTTVDLVGGMFGGIARALLESEINDGLPDIISGLRRRLERNSHVSSPGSLRHD